MMLLVGWIIAYFGITAIIDIELWCFAPGVLYGVANSIQGIVTPSVTGIPVIPLLLLEGNRSH
jgi:hypothetical protein